MRRLVFLVVFGAGCARGGDAPRDAESPPAPQITAVATIPWGLSADSIVARRGEPLSRHVVREAEVLTYPETLIGVPAKLVYLVHRRSGMIRGAYSLPIHSAAACADALRLIDSGVSERYPQLVPVVRGGAGDPCTSAMRGNSMYGKVWTDPANDAWIGLVLSPRGSALTLVYSTPEADKWESQMKESQF